MDPASITREEARAFDRDAQERLRVPGDLLMENAGAAVARAAARMAHERRLARVVVLCGTGNNGGDGFVAARHLLGTLPIEVLLAGERARVGGDAAANLARLDALGVAVFERADAARVDAALAKRDALVVDALFGTGLARPLDAPTRAIVEVVNRSGAPVLAVDLPSGLDADTGKVLGAAVVAARTITFVARKRGFDLSDGPRHVGEVEVVGIGVPAR